MTGLRRLAPGFALLLAVGALGELVGAATPLNSLVVTIALGIALANVAGVPASCKPGVATHDLWLEVGIVLMGARIALDSVLAAGVPLLASVVGVVAFTLVVAEGFSRRWFGLQRRLGSLLAAGASVCGVSAVVAVAGTVRADEDQIAYATSAILLFDALTLFAYPAVGRLLGLSGQVFGIWAGLSMFSTGPVAAAGFAYSDAAGQWATLTKLTRNVLLGVVVVAYSVVYTESDSSATATTLGGTLRRLWRGFPKFVVGFVSVILLASSGALSAAEIDALTRASHWLFLAAFAGLGLDIDAADLHRTGVRPVTLLFVTLVVVSAVSLVGVQFLF
ncbi:YeiH family protein [Halorussus caseinilyticus]|uniref:YeiH family protein n=1 Tax=Halorussus caseinilyticus TaxID=3034025 RepID=A0ABD5WST8_9EURY|nr:putative sulfate exporter family transporter [Halorussus sp. DT72]